MFSHISDKKRIKGHMVSGFFIFLNLTYINPVNIHSQYQMNPATKAYECDVISMILYDLFRKNKLPGSKRRHLLYSL